MKYIPKLQLHQHSLLTRKVFSRHNFHHWSSSLYQLDHLIICIFKSSSYSSHLHLQVFFIFKSSSSLDLDHLSIWIIMEHHHWIWIITEHHHWIWINITGLDLDHHSIWINITGLDLDHHSICIITTGSRSSLDLDHHWLSSLDLDHHWCYIMILLVTGSSTEPALFHAGCRPSLHVGIL